MTKQSKSSIFLGTAGWGKKVSKAEAYQILETFYEQGFRWVDTATNYPIDKVSANYGQTIEWLSDFCVQLPELKILVKAGSATNLGESKQIINASYFSLIFDILIGRFRQNFGGLGIHWDTCLDAQGRIETVDLMADMHNRGFAVGLSGIADPEMYLKHPLAKSLPWIYQVNFSPIRSEQVSEDVNEIRMNFPNAKVIGYNLLGGIAKKGLPIEGDRLSNLKMMFADNHLGKGEDTLDQVVSLAFHHGLDGLIIGPTNVSQCLAWCKTLDRLSHA